MLYFPFTHGQKTPKIFEFFHLVQQLPSQSMGGEGICLLAVGPKCEQSKCPRCLGTWSFSCKNTSATFPKKVICSFCFCPCTVDVDDKKMETGVLNKFWCTEHLSAPNGCHVRSVSSVFQIITPNRNRGVGKLPKKSPKRASLPESQNLEWLACFLC